jgi:hypothetical protein
VLIAGGRCFSFAVFFPAGHAAGKGIAAWDPTGRRRRKAVVPRGSGASDIRRARATPEENTGAAGTQRVKVGEAA